MIKKTKQHNSDPTFRDIHRAVKPHWPKIAIISAIVILTVIIIGQLLYPTDKLVPFAKIDNVILSGLTKKEAITKLDNIYNNKKISIFFGDAETAYVTPKVNEIGIITSNTTRINKINYPWYLRIIPLSILWAHYVTMPGDAPTFNHDSEVLDLYISKELGNSCDVKPQDASLKLVGMTFKVIPSHNGGICDLNIVKKLLSETKIKTNNNRIIIPYTETKVDITDAAARQLASNLESKTKEGISILIDDKPQTIPPAELLSWIDFAAKDGQLLYSFNEERASAYLNKEIAPKVARESGTTTINTLDFVEVSRVNGADGTRIDISTTLLSLKSFLDNESTQAKVYITLVPPKIAYTRSYSPTNIGLSALLQQYSQSHAGVFGVQLIELSGQLRRASYNENKIFTPASTYKLFVAYSTLRRIESGAWHWSDPIADVRDLSTCFDDMIVKSDNTCAETLLRKVGFQPITDEAKALGCTSTSFMGSNGIETTPADLALFMAQLQTGQMLTLQSSRDRLIDALKRNIYRSGIPSGVSGVVADKVGFLYGLLHDAAIVYSPTGTYVLVIMTDNSNWSTIADFARQIESLRSQ